jgi:two-component system, NtrC family, response regulator HydG
MSQHLLIIDDEAPVSDLLKTYFQHHGYQITTAATAREARDYVDLESFDLILLDVVLPDGDGLELLKNFKSSHPKLPIIIMTAFGLDENLMIQARNNGASGYVSKTGPLENLLQETRRSLKSVP